MSRHQLVLLFLVTVAATVIADLILQRIRR
jgi:hypothetical protein